MTNGREARIDLLREASARKSEAAVARANRAIIALDNRGMVINFNTVAAEGCVSKDFLYNNPRLRREIISRRPAIPQRGNDVVRRTSEDASTVVKLQVATEALRAMRAEIVVLRAENARLQGDLLALRRRTRK